MKIIDSNFAPAGKRWFRRLLDRLFFYETMSGNGTCPVYLERFRSFPAEHLHRVRASPCGNCWTLVIVLRKSRPWGFVQDGRWIPFKQYVFGGKSRKSC